ncbi:ComEC/Rec2 family competence protein [Sphingomonas cavernae]|uniref:ComEC family competence protein n=1 Tax=Sphingomonas cavernae TaxID=2320861 RepID=A0A418WLU7_9SPHN|nr:ComEC/Rec2 family competence protein [Sphingomonas cavernae]RJF90974.1 ComEC family competence protein [Sphingomonas cavernae]
MLQNARSRTRGDVAARVENWLEVERDQLALWVPVALGMGIAMWFWIPLRTGWIVLLLLAASCAMAGAAIGWSRRAGKALLWFGVMAAAGCALTWWRAESLAAPVLERPLMAQFRAQVLAADPLPARGAVRLLLAPIDTPTLPPKVRVNIDEANASPRLTRSAVIDLRARIMPPPEAAVPGAYDFARLAWFQGIGGTGKALGAPVVVTPAPPALGADFRQRLTRHVRESVGGAEGALAATLATGDRGAIAEEDAEAMRRSGLAHLLSISGLHVTAVVAAAMLIVLRLLALSPTLALRWPLPLISAGAGALAGIGYTLLTGAEVPTIRSCIAALLVLGGIALGREAITLRLIAAGALFVLLLWPESIAGPSFQMSFAAVTALVALHEHPRVRALLSRRDEGPVMRLGRLLLGLLLTGLAVEIALSPIALFHFHKAGAYGALANIVAIPLTTFVIMPLEALALVFDLAGLGAPFWWLTGKALALLLGLAHAVANAPGAVAALPVMPAGAFALMVAGGLWLCLWRTRIRRLGIIPVLAGMVWALSVPPPDLLVSNDGRHLALADGRGGYALLRPRAGEYIRDALAESAGFDGELTELDGLSGARCTRDACTAEIIRGARRWRLLATRSNYMVPWETLRDACANADIVVSERRLPDGCQPRWLKADRMLLAETGGLAIHLGAQHVQSVRSPGDHPWLNPPRPEAPPRQSYRGDRRQ